MTQGDGHQHQEDQAGSKHITDQDTRQTHTLNDDQPVVADQFEYDFDQTKRGKQWRFAFASQTGKWNDV